MDSRLFLLAVVLALSACKPTPSATPSSAAPPRPPQSSITSPPWFDDITTQAKLHFLHDSGAQGRFHMFEHIGSGAALVDFDNDQLLDIYLIHNGGPQSQSRNQLFHQLPDGTFRDVSAGSGLDVAGHGMGVAVGDVNNDGWRDVLLTEYGAIRLFLNQTNGTFVDVSRAAGLDNPRWATAAAFFDMDRDGWLDLIVGNYIDFDPTHQCYDDQGAQDYCGPERAPPTLSRLFRNLGPIPNATSRSVRFADVTVASGLVHHPGQALGVACLDFNGDRWPDILLADDGLPNRLLINQRNGTFTEEAAWRGLAFTALGQTAANMGVALGDVDGNGLFDVFISHLTEEFHNLWTQQPQGLFQDKTAQAGLTQLPYRGTGFGTTLADFNLDGFPDIALVNGRIKRDRSQPNPSHHPTLPPFWIPYAQQSQLLANDGHGRFLDVSASNPAFCATPFVGRGLACGDIDNDGDLDLLTTGIGGPAKLYRNVAPTTNHWLLVNVIDPALGGRDAYGAELRLHAGGRIRWGFIQPAHSYLSSNDPRAHFGLGTNAAFEAIDILWPEGTSERFPGGPANQILTLKKGSGTPLQP